MVALLVALASGYLCGSLPWGLWLGRWLRGVDVRTLGSGNLGATNVNRTLGPAVGIPVLALDIAKGALPTWLVPGLAITSGFPGGVEWCRITVGLAAVLGHVFTLFASFRGGKGVATTVGVLLALSPPAFGVFVLVFVAVVAITRFISLGSIFGSLAFAATLAVTAPHGFMSPTAPLGAVLAIVVIVRHQENIARLLRGEERRFSFKRGPS